MVSRPKYRIGIYANINKKIYVYNRYHRRFIEVANAFYITKLTVDDRRLIFANVVDFFDEKWKRTPKPYKYNNFLQKKLHLGSACAEQIRNTSMQPTVFVDASGTLRYNKRKLSELPTFIAQLTANLAVPLACEHVFFNFHFITGLFMTSNFNEIIATFNIIKEKSEYQTDQDIIADYNALCIMALSFLNCGIMMANYPKAGVTLILYRMLHLYGYRHLYLFTRRLFSKKCKFFFII